MNIRHSSTGKRALHVNFEPISLEDRLRAERGQGLKLEDLSISLDFLTPNNSNSDALKRIKSRIAKNKEILNSLNVADDRKIHKSKMNNTFISVFLLEIQNCIVRGTIS